MKSVQEKEFIERLTKWYRGQMGECMCLGDCERCGHHLCFGCACWILDYMDSYAQSVCAEKVQEVIKLIDRIESSYRDSSLEEWKAFKHIRNGIRDLNQLQQSSEKCRMLGNCYKYGDSNVCNCPEDKSFKKCYCQCHSLENFGWDQKTKACEHCSSKKENK